jgi:hypothetical protein
VAKKSTMVDEMIGDVKKAAGKIGEAVGAVASGSRTERVVPVPQIDTYSELPFGLVEKQGVLTGTRPKPRFPEVIPVKTAKKAAPPARAAKKASAKAPAPAKKSAKSAVKKAVKKSAPSAKKKPAKKRG